MKPPKPAPFVLIATHHGSMIVNRNDYHMVDNHRAYGVGFQLMTKSCYEPNDVEMMLKLLHLRRQHHGDGVLAIDCGANIGVHTIEWANLMAGWGHVHAFEAQERIFYALAGNIVINNCLNASARNVAVGSVVGEIDIPEPNYLTPASYGSFELKKRSSTEFIGQSIDYDHPTKKVAQITLDSLSLPRVDLLKIDVEGMEEEVLTGATSIIEKFTPIMFIEVIKSDKAHLNTFLTDRDFVLFPIGMNILAIHKSDPTMKHLQPQSS